MRLNTALLILTTLVSNHLYANQHQATEFDLYLKDKNILDENFKIKDKKQLNEILSVLSAEDSKTLPIQIDQNTLIEQLQLSANQTRLSGIITTSDFNELEKDLGKKEIQQITEKNLLNNCNIFFEHQYQRQNAYHVELTLRSDHDKYKFKVSQKDCGI